MFDGNWRFYFGIYIWHDLLLSIFLQRAWWDNRQKFWELLPRFRHWWFLASCPKKKKPFLVNNVMIPIDRQFHLLKILTHIFSEHTWWSIMFWLLSEALLLVYIFSWLHWPCRIGSSVLVFTVLTVFSLFRSDGWSWLFSDGVNVEDRESPSSVR